MDVNWFIFQICNEYLLCARYCTKPGRGKVSKTWSLLWEADDTVRITDIQKAMKLQCDAKVMENRYEVGRILGWGEGGSIKEQQGSFLTWWNHLHTDIVVVVTQIYVCVKIYRCVCPEEKRLILLSDNLKIKIKKCNVRCPLIEQINKLRYICIREYCWPMKGMDYL